MGKTKPGPRNRPSGPKPNKELCARPSLPFLHGQMKSPVFARPNLPFLQLMQWRSLFSCCATSGSTMVGTFCWTSVWCLLALAVRYLLAPPMLWAWRKVQDNLCEYFQMVRHKTFHDTINELRLEFNTERRETRGRLAEFEKRYAALVETNKELRTRNVLLVSQFNLLESKYNALQKQTELSCPWRTPY